ALLKKAGIPTIAVNHSWKMAPFCDVLYAGDACWWDAYASEIEVQAERWTCSRQAAHKHGCQHHTAVGSYCSGSRAIQFSIEKGARRIILLGFDCSVDYGLHWHGPHQKTKNPDRMKVRRWHAYFQQVAAIAKIRRCTVVNCSRETALQCFPIGNLENEIGEHLENRS